MKRVLPILVALLLAGVASFGILQWSRQLSAQGQQWDVVVATRDIKPGDALRKADMTGAMIYAPRTQAQPRFWNFVFENYVQPANMGTLEGRVVNQEIKQGYPILRSLLKEIQKDRNVRDWKTEIEKGKRAISIPVEDVAAVSGLIQVGDYVDIIVTLEVPQKDDGKERVVTMPVQMGQNVQQVKIPMRDSQTGKPMTFYLMQNVRLLAVGKDTQPPAVAEEVAADAEFEALTQGAGQGRSVTVAVTPDQATLFAFTTSIGASKYMLTLRRPGDTNIIDREVIRPADFDVLLQAVGAKQP